MTPMERIEGELSDAQKRIAELEYLLARQAKAAQQGMDAAKKVAGSNLEQAKRLHAESNPEALESERAANAHLTEQIAKLEAHISSLKDDIEIHRTAEEAQIALRQKEDEREAALAAHVERLRSALNYSSEYLYSSHLNTIGHGSKAHMEMVSALDDTPATSLACRDLIKQSEALVALYNDCLGHGGDGMVRCAIMLDRAIELREQAEVPDE